MSVMKNLFIDIAQMKLYGISNSVIAQSLNIPIELTVENNIITETMNILREDTK